ncbi:MAG TPA: sulfatase-like hydrolase/transferase [Terriglobales bacterium]|nr:sulfatase-like hydrolase/transferase [Terriglobales bacterium]
MRVLRILFCFLAVSFLAGQSTPAKRALPDVFLVTIDTLRADHVHCYGYLQIETPALDLLAKDGVRFSQAFTPSPITNSSHTTILTGLLPSAHRVTDFGVPLAPSHATWAQLLKQDGYHTAAFIGAVILDSKKLAPGLDRGFDFYDNFPEHSLTKSRWGRIERRGMDVVQRAEAWLDSHPSGSHFMWVHLYDPHDPYEPPPPYSEIYRDRLYDGEIAYADSAFGHFISYLKKQGWYDGAVVIVVGDHGEGLGEHHEMTHGIFLYDSTTHVPLIVKLPKQQAAGKQVEAQVRTTDILPTVLGLLGIAAPAHLDGESLQPYFTTSETAGRAAYGETDYSLRFGWAPLRSVRDEGFKFIEAPRPELYNLHSDPAEAHNAYEPWNATVQKLRAMLADLRARMPSPQQASAGSVGKGTTDELRALGYLGPADALSSTNVPEPSLLPDPKDKIEEQNLLHSAMLATEDERPAEARMALEEVLRMDAKSPIALVQLGQLELSEKNYAKAADYLRRAVESRPNDTTTTFDYGRALYLSGDLAGAREALQTSLKLDPNQFPARLLLGETCLKLNDFNAAEDQLEAALLLQPKNAEAQLSRGKVLVAQQKFSEAVDMLLPLTRSEPANADAYTLLAQAYSGLGKKKEAQSAEMRAESIRSQKKSP